VTKSNIALLSLALLILAVLATKNRVETKIGLDYHHKINKLITLTQQKDSLIKSYILKEQALNKQLDSLVSRNDSLTSVKEKVKVRYEKVYINIKHATNVELDSVIRSNW
jgi:Na+-transporting NADH:ubiquinone oxidoreductase subunit NqrE